MADEMTRELVLPAVPQGLPQEVELYLRQLNEVLREVVSAKSYLSGLALEEFSTDGPGFKDEDDFSSDSATAAPSQQSVKALIDKHGFVHRSGSVSAVDWDQGDLTTDGTFRELDCSSIVPANAVAIMFKVEILDDAVGSVFYLRRNGGNAFVTDHVATQVANVTVRGSMIAACDGDRVVEYAGSNVTFTTIELTVTGWWLNG